MTEGGDKAAAIGEAARLGQGASPTTFTSTKSAETAGRPVGGRGPLRRGGPLLRHARARLPGPTSRCEGNIAVGRALLAEKKFPEALQKFEAVAAASESSPEAAPRSSWPTSARRSAWPRPASPTKGSRFLQAIIKDNNPEEDKFAVRPHLQGPGQLLPEAEQEQGGPAGLPVHRHPVRRRCRRACRGPVPPQQAVGRRQQDRTRARRPRARSKTATPAASGPE